MSNLNWNQIRADFHDANQSMATSSGAISQAGTIFGQLRKSILDEEQRAVDNAYREKLFNENVRQFGLEHALKEDQFRENVRQFGITSTETERHNKATEANARAGHQLLADKFAWEKAQQQRLLDDYSKIGRIMSGQADYEALEAHRAKHAEDYAVIDAAEKADADLSGRLVANRQKQAEIVAQQEQMRAQRQKQVDEELAAVKKSNPNLDADLKAAKKAFNEADAQVNAANMSWFGYGKANKEKLLQRKEEAAAKLQSLQGLKDMIDNGAPQIGDLTTPELENRMAQLKYEEEGLLKSQQDMAANAGQLAEARQRIEADRPELLRPQIMANPALMFAYAAQNAPSIAPQMMDLWKTDMTQTSKALQKQADHAFQEHLARLKISEGRKTELLKLKSDIPSEVAKLHLDSDYEPYFQRIIQNALLFAEEKGVKVTPKEMVAVAKNALEVQKVLGRDQYETNSWSKLQRLVGGTSVIREQAATEMADEMEDNQLQQIVNYIMRQGVLQQRRAARN